MKDNDASQMLRNAVMQATADSASLRIVGSDSKAFYGRETQGRPLPTGDHRGVVNYQPTELVITARAGTPLWEIEAALAERGQMLGFEPPYFGSDATLGGTIACGLSGPRRPYTGAVRDFVLGMRILNGRGEMLHFGGEVMKNVAGYDVSRLMAGALGTLGVILEVSLKVLPLPSTEHILVHQCSISEAITSMNRWAGKPYPVSAAAHDGEHLYIRLSGAAAGVQAAARQIGGDRSTVDFWLGLREQTHPFFSDERPLWRLSIPPATPPMDLPGNWLLDWGGAQRWLHSDAPAEVIRDATAAVGGHATRFRGGDRREQVFHPLGPVLRRLHRQLKESFDPHGIFNPGRMYADF